MSPEPLIFSGGSYDTYIQGQGGKGHGQKHKNLYHRRRPCRTFCRHVPREGRASELHDLRAQRLGGRQVPLSPTTRGAATRWAPSWAFPRTTPSTMSRSSAASRTRAAPSSTATTKIKTATSSTPSTRATLRAWSSSLEMRNQVKKFGELLATKYKGYDVNGHRGVGAGPLRRLCGHPGSASLSRARTRT
jgi:hypothetical protein